MAANRGITTLLLAVLAAFHVACVGGIRAAKENTGELPSQQHPAERLWSSSFRTRRLLAPSPGNDSSSLSNFNSGAPPVVQQPGPVQQNVVEPQAVQQLIAKQQQSVQQQSVQQPSSQQQAAAPPQQPFPQPQPQASSLQGGSCPDAAATLSAINAVRSRRGAAPLSWSPGLAQSAQAWANNCVLDHSNYAAQGVGETVMWGPVPGTCTAAVGAWAAEEGKWVPGWEPTDPYFGAGHFTQLVWKSTTDVGCGLNTCGGQFVVACHFAPPGNMPGAFSTNVG